MEECAGAADKVADKDAVDKGAKLTTTQGYILE